MKKIKLFTYAASSLIAASMFCSSTVMAAKADEVTVILDGEVLNFDVPAQIIDGRTMVPMRAIFEKLGAVVEWDGEANAVHANKLGIYIYMPIGSTEIGRNNVPQTIDVPAQIVDERTLVPVRVISEYMGATVDWNQETKTVYITSNDTIQYLDWNDNYYYFGEVSDSKANGYGMLYAKSDDALTQTGLYVDSKIIKGCDYNSDSLFIGEYTDGKPSYGTAYFSNNEIYIGTFSNNKLHGAGKYYWPNGEYYEGEFLDGERNGIGTYYYDSGDHYYGEFYKGVKQGSGIYYWADGCYLEGQWENDTSNGPCVFYDVINNLTYSGNYSYGLRHGDFAVTDNNTGLTEYIAYKNGEIYTMEAYYTDQITEIQQESDEILQEYNKLGEWYEEELEKLNDYIMNGDPFSTDWAKSIYEQYDISSEYSYSGNVDSFAAANAERQIAAYKAKAEAAIIQYNQTYIENWKKQIELEYQIKLDELRTVETTLQRKYENILRQMQNAGY